MGEDEEIEHAVRLHGWQLISVGDGDPPFIYSVGLTPKHPETIVFGLESKVAAAVLNEIAARVKQGDVFDHKGVYETSALTRRFAVREVHQTQVPLYFGYAIAYCRRAGSDDLRAIQVYWPDKHGRFPFDIGCDQDTYNCQPRLDIGLTAEEVEAWERQWE